MVKKSADYALVIGGAVRHVGLKLEGAAPAALSFSDLAKGYEHPVPSDLNRVKRHEKVQSDYEAVNWVIRYAVGLLNGGLAVDGDMVSFAPGKGFDDLRLDRKKLERPEADIHAKFNNPFDLVSGVFSENIREELRGHKDPAYDELRDAMKAVGWIKEFPAIIDEFGVVLVGHRRLTIAKELGIVPVVTTVTLGRGDAADAYRLKLAIYSNIASKQLTPTDRKRIATHLYKDADWSQERIAEALNVSQSQVQRDLSELPAMGNSRRGRPKGSGRQKRIDDFEADADVAEKILAENPQATLEEIGKALGGTQQKAKTTVAFVRGRQAAAKPAPAPVFQAEETAQHECQCPHCGNRHTRQPG